MSFTMLVVALSIPFWLIGAVTQLELLPGLPLAALMAFCPAIAASTLVYRAEGTAGVARLLKRSFDYCRTTRKLWYIPIIGLMPAVMVMSYAIMRWIGLPLPTAEMPMLLERQRCF